MSKVFFQKEWTQLELDGLISVMTTAGKDNILPLRYGIIHEELAKVSPILAGIFSRSWDEGIDKLANEVKEIVNDRNDEIRKTKSISKIDSNQFDIKGSRKTISDKDKELLKEKVYEPCYNAMKNVYDRRKYLEEIPPNPWNDLTNALKLKTEPEMKELFNEYSRELDKWHLMFIDRENDYFRQRKELSQIIESAFNQAGLLNTGGNIRLPKDQNISLDSWLDTHKFVLLDPSVNSVAELIEKLLNLAHSRSSWHEKTLQHFNEKTDLFRFLAPLLPKLRDSFKTEVSYEELSKQREVMKSLIERVTTALEDKLKETVS